LFGVKRRWSFGLAPVRRATFVIDKAGICRGAFVHEMSVGKHVDDVMGTLEEISAKSMAN
jgi:peroxiredoxin